MDTLAFWYQVIIASYPLMDECIYLLGGEGFEGELKAFLKKRLAEDRHQAERLKEDLGDHPFELHFTAAAIAGTAYYLIRHLHPVCLLGYFKALEAQYVGAAVLDDIERAHGERAVRTARRYVASAPARIREMDLLPVPEQCARMVEVSRMQTLHYFDTMKPAANAATSLAFH